MKCIVCGADVFDRDGVTLHVVSQGLTDHCPRRANDGNPLELHVNDMVQARRDTWPDGHWVTGRLRHEGNGLIIGDMIVAWLDGSELDDGKEVKILERAPLPAYVNSDPMFQTIGDVYRNADPMDHLAVPVYMVCRNGDTRRPDFINPVTGNALPERKLLLVDGRTGQVVTDPKRTS